MSEFDEGCFGCGEYACDGSHCGESRCHECGEWKNDPSDFYDGLICTMCVEQREQREQRDRCRAACEEYPSCACEGRLY